MSEHKEWVNKELHEKEMRGSRVLILSCVTGMILVCLVLLWFIVYSLRSNFIEQEVNELQAVVSEDTTDDVSKVGYIIDNYEYTQYELIEIAGIPTVMDVHVYYNDGSDMIKSAYTCYSDTVSTVTYVDGTYGKIILPE